MDDHRDVFRLWTDCLLDPTRTPGEHREAAFAWCEWGLEVLGVNEHQIPAVGEAFFANTTLPTGKAISPLGAARCVREQRRTAVFLQAMDMAIRTALRRFPGDTIHVVEAGCGPLAALSLPFALRYPADRVVFTLLDLHPTALAGAKRIVTELGLDRSIRQYLATDAATVRFAEEDRPNVIACEVLLRALTREPQVAVTSNLAPQLRAGGCFVPERIDVDAVLFDFRLWQSGTLADAGTSPTTGIAELGNVFSLDAQQIDRLERAALPFEDESAELWFRANTISVPVHDPRRTPLRLFTRIRVFGDHRLGDFDSSLNLPERVAYSAELAAAGGQLEFAYECSSNPGLRTVG